MFAKTKLAVIAGLIGIAAMVAASAVEAKAPKYRYHGHGGGHVYAHYHGYHNYYRGGYRGGGCWNCGYGYGYCYGWGGFGAGLAFGTLMAAPYYGSYYAPRYYAPRAYYAPRYYAAPRYSSRVAYCKARFRSYNVATRTYLGYDGRRHYCGA